MQVKELIEVLSKLDPETEVVIQSDQGVTEYFHGIEVVSHDDVYPWTEEEVYDSTSEKVAVLWATHETVAASKPG